MRSNLVEPTQRAEPRGRGARIESVKSPQPVSHERRTFFAALLAFAALVVPAHADESVLIRQGSAYGTIIVTEDGEGLRTLRFREGRRAAERREAGRS